MTYSDLLQMLLEAEDRIKNFDDEGIKQRSQETVDLCLLRMNQEGISREQLIKLAKKR